MWDKIIIPERRLDDREFNQRNCTTCEFCGTCNGVKTTRKKCTGCQDCFVDPKLGISEDQMEKNGMPCMQCEICENDLRFVDCYDCTKCRDCELLMDVMKPPKMRGHSVVVAE